MFDYCRIRHDITNDSWISLLFLSLLSFIIFPNSCGAARGCYTTRRCVVFGGAGGSGVGWRAHVYVCVQMWAHPSKLCYCQNLTTQFLLIRQHHCGIARFLPPKSSQLLFLHHHAPTTTPPPPPLQKCVHHPPTPSSSPRCHVWALSSGCSFHFSVVLSTHCCVQSS